MRRASLLLSCFILLFQVGYAEAFPRPALSGTHSASARTVPWGGSWWPMETGELVLGWSDGAGRRQWSAADVKAFDECIASYSDFCVKLMDRMAGKDGRALSPMMKFDFALRKMNERVYGPGGAPYTAYSRAAKWDLENHYVGNNPSHRHWEAREFAGKCIGWALSTYDYAEPTQTKVFEGVVFHPADIKGILAALYNGAQFFIPADAVIGTTYRDGTGTQAEYEDVLPHDLLRALSLTVDRGLLLEADLEPGHGVWNYPIFRYDLRWKLTRSGLVSGELVIHYADDEVGFDEVFSTQSKRTDLKSRKLPFEMKVAPNWNGDFRSVVSSRWVGEAVGRHPDALILWMEKDWRRSIYDYRNTRMAQEVNFQLLKRINTDGRRWVPFVDLLLDAYYR